MNKNQPQPQVIVVSAQSQALPALVNFMCFPGLGQLIQGRPFAALFWWTAHGLAAASCLIGIGLILWPLVWIGCVLDAAMYKPDPFAKPAGLVSVLFTGVVGAGLLIVLFTCGSEWYYKIRSSVAQKTLPESQLIAVQPEQAAQPDPSNLAPSQSVQNQEIPSEEIPREPMVEEPTTTDTAAKLERDELIQRLATAKANFERVELAKWREWTSADGAFRTEAKFISFIGTKVKLEKRDGKVITVDVTVLSPDDISFIRGQKWLKE